MTLAFLPVDPIECAFARIAHWRRSALRVRNDFEADLCEWFGFTSGQARLVGILYAAAGPISRDRLMVASGLKPVSLPKYLARAREALGEGAIPEQAEGAYQMTQAGRAACDEAVAQCGMGRLRKELAA